MFGPPSTGGTTPKEKTMLRRDSDPSKPVSAEQRTLACLVGLALLIVLIRAKTYGEAISRDETAYAVIAHELLLGNDLYSELRDQKPPAIHITYMLGECLFGYGPSQIYWMGVCAAIATLVGVYAVTSTGLAGHVGGLWAAGLWAATCSDLQLEANQPNSEVFINAFFIWALVIYLRRVCESKTLLPAAAVGLMLGWASLYKHVIVVPAGLLMAAHAAFPPTGRGFSRWPLLQIFVMGSTVVAVWVATAGYFAASGRLLDFYECLFAYNAHYAATNTGGLLNNLLILLTPKGLFPATSSAVLPLFFAAGGLICCAANASKHQIALASAVWLGMLIAVALPGRFYPHYYQLLLPLGAIAAGKWFSLMPTLIPGCTPRFAGLVGGGVLALLACFQLPTLALSADEWSLRKHGTIFVAARDLGLRLNALLLPDEHFFEWGGEPNLYFYSKRRMPRGSCSVYALSGGPLAETMTESTLTNLKAHPPEVFVINVGDYNSPDSIVADRIGLPSHPLLDWALKNYAPVPGNSVYRNWFAVLALKGGRLEQHLRAAGTAFVLDPERNESVEK